jgi:hypothetical protein
MPCSAIHAEGALIPEEILDQIAREELPGQKAVDFGFPKGTRLGDEIARAWSDAQDYWRIFSRHAQDLAEGETGATPTRERWMAPLFNHLLGYELTYQQAGAVVGGQTFPISHRAGAGPEWPPVHIAGLREELDRRPESGRRRLSPQALVQEFLNRTDDHLWGIVTNGYVLRLLRQTTRTSRPSYLEFDLQSILDGQRYTEFALFFRLCHRTRLPRPGADPHKCLLEEYFQKSIEQGGRVREHLREGVEEALKIVGTGFLRHPANRELTERLQKVTIPVAEFHRQLLRLVYRLLFLMVAEERKMILPEGAEADRQRLIYERYYSIARLRILAERVLEETPYEDLWLGLKQTFKLFNDVPGTNPLGIPPLNGELFSSRATPLLDGTHLYNHDLLRAMRHLSLFVHDKVRQRINYAALDVEELGSVYESLLDLEPYIDPRPEGLAFDFHAGTQRKSTGSYYTRPELVAELIESALVPVLEERVKEAATREEKERTILGMKVCDPACGSGHFLLAAARRMGRELAKVRTGEEEPTPKDFHLAVRDVIAHCLYAVDKNPLAVDLCKVALWLEGHWTGKPLSFLDHRIKCGDSLIGVFNPAVFKEGIPDEAFKPLTGDDKGAASAIKKRNKQERERPQRQLDFEQTAAGKIEDYAQEFAALGEIAENTPADVKRKADLYHKLSESVTAHQAHRAANLWTAAFFVSLTDPRHPYVPTTETLRDYLERPNAAHGQMIGMADSLGAQHKFLHWFLEFPEVFAAGGFDVVLGNPPWEMLQPEEIKFFAAEGAAAIAQLSGARRKGAIQELRTTNPELAAKWYTYQRDIETANKFVRGGERFNLTAVGKLNTYALFAELARSLLNSQGRAGIIVPTGIATDDACKGFFGELNQKRGLASLFDFENREALFPAVDSRMKFSLLTMAAKPAARAEFAFFLTRAAQLHDAQRRFTLTAEDLALLNPNTRTGPVFRTRADAELTKQIYQRVPVLVNERTGENPWGVQFMQGLFNMTSDSGLFQTAPGEGLVPLYEAKMLHQFDHRWATYERGETRDCRASEKADPRFRVEPRYWVPAREVDARLEQWNKNGSELVWRWEHKWLLGFRDITNATNERTAIFSLLPRVGVGHTAPLVIFGESAPTYSTACLLGSVNSIALDYVARQKVGGTHLTYGYLNQLPVLPPGAYEIHDLTFIVPRVLELVYTAWDIKPFGDDLWREAAVAPPSRRPASETLALPEAAVAPVSDRADGAHRAPLQQSGAQRAPLQELIRRQWEENKAATGGHEFNPPAWAEIAQDGIPLAPFKWDEDRRARLRAELDAYYALLYGLTRKQLRYILNPADLTRKELENILDPWEEVSDPLDDRAYRERAAQSDFPGETFRVLKEKEERLFGEYRTRRLVLEAFDKLTDSPRFYDEEPKHEPAITAPQSERSDA